MPPLGKPYAERRCCGGPLEQLEWMLKTHSAPSVSALHTAVLSTLLCSLHCCALYIGVLSTLLVFSKRACGHAPRTLHQQCCSRAAHGWDQAANLHGLKLVTCTALNQKPAGR